MEYQIPDKEFFSIGEVSRYTHVEPYVLRYWENKCKLVRPSRRDSGHRKFSRKDLENILKIKELLYAKGFTISGAKKFMNQESRKKQEQMKIEFEENGAAVDLLQKTKETLEEIVKILK